MAVSKSRTTVILDDDLLKRAKEIGKTDSTTEAITFAMRELVRAQSRKKLADLLGSDATFESATRRRPE